MVIAAVVLAQMTLGSNSVLTYHYDKFKDVSVVSIGDIALGQCDIQMVVAGHGTGPGFDVPTRAEIGFISTSPEWRYLRSHAVTFLADGARFPLSHVTQDGSIGEGFVVESVGTGDAPLDALDAIGAGHDVQVQVGGTECVLGGEARLAVKQVADEMHAAHVRSLKATISTPTPTPAPKSKRAK